MVSYEYKSTFGKFHTGGRNYDNGYDDPSGDDPVEPKLEHPQARAWEMCGMAMADGVICWSWRREIFPRRV